MNQLRKQIVKFTIILIVTIGLVTAFSIPFGVYPKLGNFLFPGSGSIWEIQQEIVNKETIKAPALENDVTVYRDEWGVPHIYGNSEKDLVFALGYVQAQDRLFQMDMARRATRGKLSEIIGPSMIESDKFSLNQMMDYWAVQTLEELVNSPDPKNQEIYEELLSYTDGINYFIENSGTLPLEFLFLDYEPDLWSPVDTLGFVKYMTEMLTWDYEDFTMLLLEDTLGNDVVSELFGYPLPYQIPVTSEYGEYTTTKSPKQSASEILNSFVKSDNKLTGNLADLVNKFMSDIRNVPGEIESIENSHLVGSNNNAVSGNKTSSGKPILSNDMHLSYNLPGIWYEAHLVNQDPSSDFNVYGFFLAGVPYQIVGHNAYVGWGMTNTGIDVLDWYYYKGINDTHYWFNDVPTRYETVEYVIPVKGQEATNFVIRNTVHGPVFTDLFDPGEYTGYVNDVIACKWIAHNTSEEFRAIYEWSHSKNRADFDEACGYFSSPAQNIVYADVWGNIGIRPTGKIPIRDDSINPIWHYGNGSMPYNGSAGEGEWISYIPFDELPHSENPDQGFVVSANQISAGPDYLQNYTIQNPLSVADGYRARSINDMLSEAEDLTIEDLKEIQLDVYSIKAGNFTPYLLDVLDSLSSMTTLQQAAYDLLVSWDYQMFKEESAPTVFYIWSEVFLEETFADEMNAAGSPEMPNHAILEWYTKNNSTSIWFDNVTTPAVETRDDIILLSFNIAINALEEFFGTEDVGEWKWGDINQLYFPHITGLSSLGDGPHPVDGSGDTANVIWMKTVWRDGQVHVSQGRGGASERLIIDFANLNNTLSVIPSGQRGISFSAQYTDQLEMFLNHEYHVQYFAADSVEKFTDEWIESSIFFKSGGN